MDTPSETGESSLKKVGVLKETCVAEWTVPPRRLRRARSDFFPSDFGLNSLVLINESDQPENMIKLTLWLYMRALVKHTLEVSLSLLDDENRECYAVEKRVSNSTSETRKVCATLDFSIIQHPPQKFLHKGALRIQCSICVVIPESVSSSLKPSKKDFNKLEALLQKHLENIEKAGVLTKKHVFTWVVSESIMKTKEVKVRSDLIKYEFSDFYFTKLNKSKNSFQVCLNRKTPNFRQQEIQITLAVLDNSGGLHYVKEEVTQGSSEVLLNYGEVFSNRGKFLDKGELKICCCLQTDNSLKVWDIIASKPGGSSEPSKLEIVSYPTVNSADVKTNSSDPSLANELTKSNKLCSKSVRNHVKKLEDSIFVYSKADKSKIEKALKEMLKLLPEERVDTVVIVYKKTNED